MTFLSYFLLLYFFVAVNPDLVSLVGPDPDLGRSEWSTRKGKTKLPGLRRAFFRAGGVSCSFDVLNKGFKKISSMFLIQMFGQANFGLDKDSAKSLSPNPEAVDLDPKQYYVIVKHLT